MRRSVFGLATPSGWEIALLAAVACFVPAALGYAAAAPETGRNHAGGGTAGGTVTNIPVLVMSEDEDPTTVTRSSDIFKRVLAELKGAMQRHGFRMIDEESVAVDLGWTITDRRPKSDLLEAIKLMNRSHNASHQVRASVLFRVHAQARQLDFGTRVRTRIDGEIYDAASNQFLDAFEMPQEEYPAAADCLRSARCIDEVVGDRAREIAAGLGEVLALKLERYSPPRSGPAPPPRTRGVPADSGRAGRDTGHGLLTPYTVTMRYFGSHEALAIVGVMAEEFPGYRSHDLMVKSAAVRRYEYLSSAKAYKLEEWLYVLLRDMGFDMDREILIQVQGTKVTIDKLTPTPQRPESDDERRRFR